MAEHVMTVTCPSCKRPWTGSFPVGEELTDKDKECKDCK